jgi:MoaA/NifB/PqqE/SkfB family radical SAM enzyme
MAMFCALSRPLFGDRIEVWPLPDMPSIFGLYGLWNCLIAYEKDGNCLGIIPAHDGDFFPNTPFDYIELMRSAAREGKDWPGVTWPVRVDIDITQDCTSRCFFCYSRPYATTPPYRDAYMPKAMFESLVRELAVGGTRAVRLTGGGEPLAHPEIAALLAIPHKYGLRSCVITNGDLLDDDIVELLVQNIDHVRISINAGKNDTRQALHHSRVAHADLAYIHRQIQQITWQRSIAWPGERRPSIWITFLILPQNLSEISLAAKAIRECGADSISFRPAYHDFYRQLGLEERGVLRSELQRASDLHHPPEFQVFIPKRDLSEASHLQPKMHFSRCISCAMRTVIETTTNGSAIELCGLYRGTSGEVIGVMNETRSFRDIWLDSRTEQRLTEWPNQCRGCIDVSMNVNLNHIWGILRSYPDAIFRRGWQRRESLAL